MQMVRAVAALGFGDLYATPHQRSGMFMPAREAIDGGVRGGVRGRARRRDRPYAWAWAPRTSGTTCCTAACGSGPSPSYGGGPAFLFEVHPQFMPAGLENELFQLRVARPAAGHGPPRALRRRSSATWIWPSASGATP